MELKLSKSFRLELQLCLENLLTACTNCEAKVLPLPTSEQGETQNGSFGGSPPISQVKVGVNCWAALILFRAITPF